jgi:hypothetical protein
LGSAVRGEALGVLDGWIVRAATAGSCEEVFAEGDGTPG